MTKKSNLIFLSFSFIISAVLCIFLSMSQGAYSNDDTRITLEHNEDFTIVYFDSSDIPLYLPEEYQESHLLIAGQATEKPSENKGFFSYITSWEGIKNLGETLVSALNYFKETNSYGNYMKEDWDKQTEDLLGKGFLQFGGYYQDEVASGCTPYGQEINDKIRVTVINGILNIRYDLETLLKVFSTSHGDIPIHFVFRPTEGWTKDILTSTFSKMGYTSTYATFLAKTWKDMIQEMGGVDQGGKIIHYAHSIGATDTYVARRLLTPEELKMIHVITLGSPSIIPNTSGFGSVKNYVSIRDGVCLLDPIGYFMDSFNGNSQTEFIGTFWGIPLVDHTLYTDSYGAMILELGKDFIRTHSPLSSK